MIEVRIGVDEARTGRSDIAANTARREHIGVRDVDIAVAVRIGPRALGSGGAGLEFPEGKKFAPIEVLDGA